MGPYVIHNLSSSGAVHLATLDGEPMTNWISGCRLKKYHEPLTKEILDRLHATKLRAKQKEEEKAQAQLEAQERRNKFRRNRQGLQEVTVLAKRMRINAVQEIDQTPQGLRPYIMVEIGKNYQPEVALFDTGADINSLSYEAWERIDKPTLNKSDMTIRGFVGNMNPVEGYLELPVFLGNTNVKHRFYVMKPGKVLTQVILGQPWQRTYNGVPNWRREGINFEFDHARLFTPFLTEDDFTTDSDSDKDEDPKEEPTKQTDTSGRNGEKEQDKVFQTPKDYTLPETTANQAKTQADTRGKKEWKAHSAIWVPKNLARAQAGTTHMWVPKKVLQKNATCAANATNKQKAGNFRNASYCGRKQKEASKQQVWLPKERQGNHYRWEPKRNQANKLATLKWIPKRMLQAQGFFEGNTHVWLPKSQIKPAAAKNETKDVNEPTTKQVVTTQHHTWRPKGVDQTIPKPSVRPRLTTAQKGKWIPKSKEDPNRLVEAASTSQTAITIAERAILLQVQLFGMLSFKSQSTLAMASLARNQAALHATLLR